MRKFCLLVSVSLAVSGVVLACTNGDAESSNQGGTSRGGSSGTGGRASGGSSGTGGKSASGGSASGGSSNSTGGSGSGGTNANSGGSATSGGSSGSGGSAGASNDGKRAVKNSAGCGKTSYSKDVNQSIETEGGTGNFIVSLPSSYDPSQPYPLGFAFHGYGRTHQNCQNGDCLGFQSVMKDEAILIYMKSFGPGWEQGEVRDDNAQFFLDVMAKMKSEYCVDENRVFVAGTSSGAAFSAILACRYGDQLIASVPVAGSMPEKSCNGGRTPMLVIHGIQDKENSIEGGKDIRDYYVQENDCSDTSVPPFLEVEGRVSDDRDAKIEGYECADFQNCSAGFPVRWCVHSEGGYDDVNHGWPTFGGKEIWDFVKAL